MSQANKYTPYKNSSGFAIMSTIMERYYDGMNAGTDLVDGVTEEAAGYIDYLKKQITDLQVKNRKLRVLLKSSN